MSIIKSIFKLFGYVKESEYNKEEKRNSNLILPDRSQSSEKSWEQPVRQPDPEPEPVRKPEPVPKPEPPSAIMLALGNSPSSYGFIDNLERAIKSAENIYNEEMKKIITLHYKEGVLIPIIALVWEKFSRDGDADDLMEFITNDFETEGRKLFAKIIRDESLFLHLEFPDVLTSAYNSISSDNEKFLWEELITFIKENPEERTKLIIASKENEEAVFNNVLHSLLYSLAHGEADAISSPLISMMIEEITDSGMDDLVTLLTEDFATEEGRKYFANIIRDPSISTWSGFSDLLDSMYNSISEKNEKSLWEELVVFIKEDPSRVKLVISVKEEDEDNDILKGVLSVLLHSVLYEADLISSSLVNTMFEGMTEEETARVFSNLWDDEDILSCEFWRILRKFCKDEFLAAALEEVDNPNDDAIAALILEGSGFARKCYKAGLAFPELAEQALIFNRVITFDDLWEMNGLDDSDNKFILKKVFGQEKAEKLIAHWASK